MRHVRAPVLESVSVKWVVSFNTLKHAPGFDQGNAQ